MKFEHHKHPATNDYHVSLVIEGFELRSVRFTDFDRALFRECEDSESIADKLLALETVARRIEEQQKRVEEEHGKDNG